MYPYYALFDEERREADEQRFWFWNSMHFPLPMPAFDAICIDTAYQALGSWQNRVFAVPPAMGIDYRCINGYIYISGNPVTDPAKIAERAGHFQQRAGHYFEHWDELYAAWRTKMEGLIAELEALEVPQLHDLEPDDVAFGDQETSYCAVLDAYRRALRLADLMWQNHFEFLLLGYGAYVTFAELCKTHLPDIPDQHIAQMVAGLDVTLFRPDTELRRLARLAIDTGVDGAFVEGRSPEEIDAVLAESESGRSWLAELEAVKDPWFHMATGDGLYHYYGSWLDDPTIPYVSLTGHIGALRAGENIERPSDHIATERERLVGEYGALLDDEARKGFDELLALSRTVFPYVEEHKFLCDYWFLTTLVEHDPRLRRPAHRARVPRGSRGRLPALAPRGVLRPGRAALDLGNGRPAPRAVVLAADRGATEGAARAARRLDSAAGGGRRARGGARPGADHAVGGYDAACPRLGAGHGGRFDPERHPGLPGNRRGRRARRQARARARRRARRRDPHLQHHVARVGADLLEDPGCRDGHRRCHVARGDRLPRVRASGGGRYRPRHLADHHGTAHPCRRLGRHRDAARVSEAGHTRPLAALRRGDTPSFGGKSATLGELIAAGIPVAPGVALSTNAFRAFVREAGLDGKIALELSRVSAGDVDSVVAASHAISEAMRFAPVPEPVRDEVARAYEALAEAVGVPEPPVAVRSSALGEDGEDATFAGQLESYLWVRGADHVCDAVRDCWVSLFGPPAIAYRAHVGQDEPAMGVAVQLMVDAEVSGVLFTCNPVSGDPSMIAVNASWGLGLAVVGGEVTPDDFLVSKITGEVVRERIHVKEIEYVPDTRGRGAVRVDVPEERRAVACLDRPALEALVETGRRIERAFGSHQDVEWAIARAQELPDGLFVLQSRAVTGLPERRSLPESATAMELVMSMFGARDVKA